MKSESRPPTAVDPAAIRARIEASQGRKYWRSLEEFAETPEVRAWLEREFAPGASEWPASVNRRSFLKMMAASLALAGASGCTKPIMKEIVPYVKQPEETAMGEPLYFATAMPLNGYGTGILVKSREGRPIKADGNAEHPASLGGSSIWIQACLLDLYNPDRAQNVNHNSKPSSWTSFLGALNDSLQQQRKKDGAGLRFLTGTVTSPTLAAQFHKLLKTFPKAQWHQYEPINRDNVVLGAQRAFGRNVATHHRFQKAKVILAVESDFLYTHPDRLRYARHFTDERRVVVRGAEMNRLYAIESTPTLTGTVADNRLPLPSVELEAAVRWLANDLGVSIGQSPLQISDVTKKWLAEVSRELQANRGKCLVTVGEFQPPLLHELAHRINHQLGNVGQTVYYTEPAETQAELQLDSLRRLTDDMRDGQVDSLFILGGNPVYDAPFDFDFAGALGHVQESTHLSLSYNETSELCNWQVPQTHFLETWGDIRSFDGTITIQQPLIEPLFGGHSEYELLGVMNQLQPMLGSYEIVRNYWREQKLWSDFERGWRKAVCDGVIENTAFPEISVQLRDFQEGPKPVANSENPQELELLFRPDANVWDGQFADNPWLQEVPKPLTCLTWDNAVLISPRLAEQNNLKTGDILELQFDGRTMRGAAWILPGQAESSVTVHLGYGRVRAGRAAINVGFNGYYLRPSGALWRGSGLALAPIGQRYNFATMQLHHRLHSEERQVYREGTIEDFRRDPMFIKKTIKAPPVDDTLYEPHEFDYPIKWGMSIDLTTCIGCNACIMACNIENNIPVVGKQQVGMGREMIWIRVDTYYKGSLDNPEYKYQPVPCMQCENAPCEYVCPVEASVHNHEGLNLQVYNRCVGTRYCSNNCPYKVRRFNFLAYTAQTTPLEALRNNPEVTVRARGVMEKCTYCLQRIAAARIQADEQHRPRRDGEVRTACQEACPTQAIVFGIMTRPETIVSKFKAHALDYPMLGELNTRPRTTYLAKLRNPNPRLEENPT